MPPAGPMTLAAGIDDLRRRGYTESFMAVPGGLRALGSGKTFGRDELVIREYHRFEGVSDPDDMSVLYAIEGLDGTRGTLVDAFGPYADPVVGAVLQDMPVRPTARAGA